MSEKTEEQPSQEPAPTKESDANRVTQEETERDSRDSEQESTEQAEE
jgi:hypothetical protein